MPSGKTMAKNGAFGLDKAGNLSVRSITDENGFGGDVVSRGYITDEDGTEWHVTEYKGKVYDMCCEISETVAITSLSSLGGYYANGSTNHYPVTLSKILSIQVTSEDNPVNTQAKSVSTSSFDLRYRTVGSLASVLCPSWVSVRAIG